MQRIILIVFVVFALTASVWAGDFVVVCPVEGMIDDGVAELVGRAVKEAAGAKALIFEIDTPGGLIDSAIEITNSILEAPCRTIAYVKGMGAISAGALISYACADIIMTPGTNIGAATPVVMSPEGMMPTGEKEVSFMRAKMRALAERNHHNPGLAEAMVDKDIELRSYVDQDGKPRVFSIYHAPGPEPAPAKDREMTPVETARKAIEDLPDDLSVIKKIAKNVLPAPAKPEAPPQETRPETPPENSDLVLPAGKLLTLTPQEAIRFGVISATASTLDEVLARYDCAAAVVRRITPTWSESLFRFLASPAIAGILLLFGIGGLYMELKAPGISLPGIVGVICLVLFFGSHFIIGAAQWIDVVLVVVGIGLILVELFVLPGFAVIGGAGILCVLVGLYLALTTVPIPRYSWDYQRLQNAGVTLSIAITSLTALVYVLWKVFPHTPIYGRIVQTHEEAPEKGYVVQTSEQRNAAIGLKGVAVSMLRPAGRGRFGDRTYSVVSRGDFIENGKPIIIVQVDGNRYVVEKLEGQS